MGMIFIALFLLMQMIIFLEFFISGGIFAIMAILLGLGLTSFAFLKCIWFGGFFLFTGVIVTLIVIKLAMMIVSKRSFTLTTDQEGYKGSSYEMQFIGRMAVVERDLRPSGFIEVEGKVLQALSEGRYIKKGTKVEIIGGQGSHLIVR